jgi:TfoX/Sxy family transcriptional regulator of competence genes
VTYDEQLADEIRDRLDPGAGEVVEKRMFGGLAFLVGGNMAIAASRTGGLLVRTDPEDAAEVHALPGVEPMEMRGRKMPGWVFVESESLSGEADLDTWLERALAFVATLPPK